MKITIESCKNGAYVIYGDGKNENKIIYKFDEESLGGLEFLYVKGVEFARRQFDV